MIWRTPVNDDDPFINLKISNEELEKIAKEVLDDPEFKAKLEKRLAPFHTKVTWRILMTILD